MRWFGPCARRVSLTGVVMLCLPTTGAALRAESAHTAQTKEIKYTRLMRPDDKAAIWLNEKSMAPDREQMKKYYYDPTKYTTYLEQLGITYPTLRPGPSATSTAERPSR